MVRLVLLISLLSVAGRAGPITVVQTRSASGVTDLFSSYVVPTFPGAVTATIGGDASCISCDQAASATIDLTMDLYTPGPIRDGIALLQLVLTSSGSVGGATHVGGAIGPYSLGSCPKDLDCQTSGYFPFELGIPFTIDLSGLANGFPPLGDAGFLVSASLQLYEVPPQGGGPAGAPVQIYLIPEPGSARLAFTGLSALTLFAFRRRRNLIPPGDTLLFPGRNTSRRRSRLISRTRQWLGIISHCLS